MALEDVSWVASPCGPPERAYWARLLRGTRGVDVSVRLVGDAAEVGVHQLLESGQGPGQPGPSGAGLGRG